MNFSDRITFVKMSDSYYDTDLGEYVESGKVEVVKPCHLSTMGLERVTAIFGSVNRHITVARLQNPYEQPFDYVKVDNRPYQVERQSNYRKGVLFLGGGAVAEQWD